MKPGIDLLEKIISIEWDMFTSVNKDEEPTSCQKNPTTFEGMRTAQFSAWSLPAAQAYLCDLETARQTGRNLIEEKYIYMMKTTEPEQYAALLPRVTPPVESALSLAQEVSAILLKQMRTLFEDYPYISGQGRPLYSEADCYNIVSVETYQLCELMTYSVKTLAALKGHITALEKNSVSLAQVILENTVRFYGYETLDTAESATRKLAQAAQNARKKVEQPRSDTE